MKQTTAKTIEQALDWIDKNHHHEIGTEFNKHGGKTHIFYKNYHEKLRVPIALFMVFKYIKPNTRKFDTRMFMLTPAGKDFLRRRRHATNVAEGMTIFESLIKEGKHDLAERPAPKFTIVKNHE